MSDDDFEKRVRDRAHQLWEEEGRPEGQSEEHWRRAAALVQSEQDAGPAPANLALTEIAGETTDAPRSAKASASPRSAGGNAGAASKTGDAPSPKPAMAPAATKSKRAPKPAR